MVFTRDMEFIHDVEFTSDGNVTFSQDAVVLTKLSTARADVGSTKQYIDLLA